MSSLRIRASTLKNEDVEEKALNHRILHNEIEKMEGDPRLVAAQQADVAIKEQKKQVFFYLSFNFFFLGRSCCSCRSLP